MFHVSFLSLRPLVIVDQGSAEISERRITGNAWRNGFGQWPILFGGRSASSKDRSCANQISKVVPPPRVWEVVNPDVGKEATDKREGHQQAVEKSPPEPWKVAAERIGLRLVCTTCNPN